MAKIGFFKDFWNPNLGKKFTNKEEALRYLAKKSKEGYHTVYNAGDHYWVRSTKKVDLDLLGSVVTEHLIERPMGKLGLASEKFWTGTSRRLSPHEAVIAPNTSMKRIRELI